MGPVRLVRLLLKVAAGLLTLAVLYLGITFVQVWWAGRADDVGAAQAIVVMGSAQYDGRPSPVLAARLDHALALWEADVAPTIVVTGGNQPGDRFTEATASANYLIERGVPDEAILREVQGTNSWESLQAASRFLRDDGISRVVLVSDPYHSLRIEAMADDLGLEATVSPTDTSPTTGLSELRAMIRETAAVALGRIIGFGRLGRLT